MSSMKVWWVGEVIKHEPTLGYFCPLEQCGGELGEVGLFQVEQQQRSEVRRGDNLLLSSAARKVRGGENEERRRRSCKSLFNVANTVSQEHLLLNFNQM